MNKQFIWELVEQILSYFMIYKTIVLRQSTNISQIDMEVSMQFVFPNWSRSDECRPAIFILT
jgi:hypothetical protein